MTSGAIRARAATAAHRCMRRLGFASERAGLRTLSAARAPMPPLDTAAAPAPTSASPRAPAPAAAASTRPPAPAATASLLRPPPTHRMLSAAPASAFRPAASRYPVRKRPEHVPAVQRWSAAWPAEEVTVATLGVQARTAAELDSSAFMAWLPPALALPRGPSTVDHARCTDAQGWVHHVVTAYFLQPGDYAAWAADAGVAGWWGAAERRDGSTGVYREVVRVPLDRLETIYWPDFPGGAMRDESVKLYPTPYCGYYGAMRDRLGAAAEDDLAAVAPSPSVSTTASASASTSASATGTQRRTFGAHVRVRVPRNTAVIRSSHTWSAMDEAQHADYAAKLAPPLATGMSYLASRPAGCLDLRNATSTDADGDPLPEMHATGVFADLASMEAWAEGHATHAAIFRAAIARYRHYGGRNQLRTWHEVFVLTGGDVWEYVNCHPETGVLGRFAEERVA